MAGGSLQKAIFDEQHRPITAGGIVKTGPVIFKDVANAAGLTKWHHTAGNRVKKLLLEAGRAARAHAGNMKRGPPLPVS